MSACRDAIEATMLDYFITEMAKVIIRGFISQAILQIESDMTMREVPFGSYDWRKT